MVAPLRLKSKMICGFSLIALIGGVIGLAGIRMVSDLSTHLQEAQNYHAFSRVTDNALEGVLEHRRREKDVFLNVENPAKKQTHLSLFNQRAIEFKKNLSRIQHLAVQIPQLTPKVRQRLAELPALHDAYMAGFFQVVAVMDATPHMSPIEANSRMQEYKHFAYELEDHLREVEDLADELEDVMVRQGVRHSERIKIALLGMALLGFCIAFGLGVLVSGKITRPLRQLTVAACELRQGKGNIDVPYRSADELGELAESFRQMLSAQQRKVVMAQEVAAGNLNAPLELASADDALGKALLKMESDMKEHIRNLTEATSARERIASELRVATEIQTSLLPRIFPPFPDRPEVDLYASMEPAKEVGGDFYDFFFIDRNRLCFLIADVADKGVPAALYMMVAKILLKSEAQRIGSSDGALNSVNHILAQDNESCLFVTVFCAILDIGSGRIQFANAGHNPPLIYRHDQGFEYLKPKAGFVLGPMAESTYENEQFVMRPGDIFFLYTDGVTEAKNSETALFGEKRLKDALNRNRNRDLKELVDSVRMEVARFSGDVPQFDDITMLAVKLKSMNT
jgi:serine phosphatase RsbU (regulator of sigma subunit)/HAMP domain-containing protein